MMLFLAFCSMGIVEGFLSGLLGIGGGIILVPALLMVFPLFDIPYSMQLAVGTSLATISITMCSSLHGHFKYGDRKLLWQLGRKFIPGVIVGTLLGAFIAVYLSTKQLAIIFGLVVWLLAVRMLFLKEITAYRILPRWKHWRLPSQNWINIITFAIALISAMTGIGGGILMVTYLQIRHVPMRIAIPLALIIHIPEAWLGAGTYMFLGQKAHNLPHWTTGYVYWPAVLAIICTSIIMAQVGVRVSHKVTEKFLRWFFVIFALATGAKMIFFT